MRKIFILATVLFFCSKVLFAASITEELTQLNNLYKEGAITKNIAEAIENNLGLPIEIAMIIAIVIICYIFYALTK